MCIAQRENIEFNGNGRRGREKVLLNYSVPKREMNGSATTVAFEINDNIGGSGGDDDDDAAVGRTLEQKWLLPLINTI